MIAANDVDTTFLRDMAPDQLRAVLAHAGGLLAYKAGEHGAALVMHRIAEQLVTRSATMRQIADAVAQANGFSLDQLKSGRQLRKEIGAARHQAMWEMHRTGIFSNAQIAGFFGLKDHTTVVHGRQAHEARQAEQRAGA